jgi:hypothetical protein
MKNLRYLLIACFILLSLLTNAQSPIQTLDSALTYLHQRQLFNGTALLAEKGKVLSKKPSVRPTSPRASR